MRRFPIDVFIRPLAGLAVCASVALTQETPGSAKVLEKFFELGLPDAKGGKWVQCYSPDSQGGSQLPGGQRAEYSGNAWLLRDANGTVEAVMADGRLVRGKKLKDEESGRGYGRGGGGVQIKPANLEQDLKLFSAGLRSPGDARRSGDPERWLQERAQIAGASLLFLAQLQRQGRADFVHAALPQVLALVPSPDVALDGAVSILADGQLAALLRAWVEKGDAAAYAAGIEKLAATFTRGWKNRDAALLLAAGLREQKSGWLAGDADAKRAADFLMNLKMADFGELPMGRNWFLSDAGGRRRYGRFPVPEPVDPGDENDEPPGRPAKQGGPGAAFFAKKREAAMALAKLLDDHRYVRFGGGDDSEGPSFSFGGHKSREEAARERYNQIPRAREIGEMAWAILSPLLPEEIRNGYEEKPATRAASAIAWLKTAAARSDEELAWDYLRSAGNTYDEAFQNGLKTLVEKGGPDTLVKLREVFLDAGVWNSNSIDEMIAQTEQYVKRAPADAAFPDKLRAAAKAGFDREEADQGRSYSGDGMEEMKKQLAARRSAQMKQLDQLFKPPQNVADQVAEIAAMEETEALAALEAAGRSFLKKGLAEIESPLLQAAAKAKSPKIKGLMLQTVMGAEMRGQQPGRAAAPPAFPGDTMTRDAVQALLRDESVIPREWDPNESTTIAGLTSWAIVGLHAPQSRQEEWRQLLATAPRLANRWLRTHVIAITAGQPVPPIPDASRLAAGRAATLVTELGALPAGQVTAALDAKSPDEQLAILGLLGKTDRWPASLMEAHLTIREVAGGQKAEPGDPDWKGHRLDEKMLGELMAAVEKSADEGKFHVIFANVAEPLAGVRIAVTTSPQKTTPDQLTALKVPGLSGKAAPVAFIFAAVQSGENGRGSASTGFGFPVWKDAAVSRAWRDEHGQPKPAPKKEEGDHPGFSANPGPFHEKLRDCFSGQKNAHGPFRLIVMAYAVGKDAE